VRILLIHGMGRTVLSAFGLARRLRAEGHEPETFGYLPLAQSYASIVDRLARRLDRLAAAGPYAAVGHSLGGVLLRSAGAVAKGAPPEVTVMLGTPNQRPRLAVRLARLWPYRWFTGECGANLASEAFYASLPPPRGRTVVVAGTRGPRGRLSPFGGEPNDGIVSVSETRLRDGEPPIEIAAMHTFLMSHAAVREIVGRVLGELHRVGAP